MIRNHILAVAVLLAWGSFCNAFEPGDIPEVDFFEIANASAATAPNAVEQVAFQCDMPGCDKGCQCDEVNNCDSPSLRRGKRGFCGLFKQCPTDPGFLFPWHACQTGGVARLSDPIVTDRPDFTEASSVVGLGVKQLETGYTYFSDDSDDLDGHTYPELLLRYGIFRDWLELRVGWTYVDSDVAGQRDSGSDDLYLGFKIGLTAQEGCLPEMALIPQMTVPTGADAFTSDKVLPGLNVLYSWELTDMLSFAANTQVNRRGDINNTYTEWAQSVAVGVSLTDRFGGYAEYFGLYPTDSTIRSQNFFNGGFTFLLTDDILWDIRAGTGLDDNSIDLFAGTGLSVRWY